MGYNTGGKAVRLRCVGVGISAGLPCMGWTVRGSNPGGGEIFPAPVQTRLCGPRSLLYNGYRVFPAGKRGRGVALTTHPI